MNWRRARAREYVTDTGYRIRRDTHLRQWTAWDPEGFAFARTRTLREAKEQAEWWERRGRVQD